jgi:bis(5'-nucleosyl)-tetraphosphatase (symmetrical)
MTTYAIGDLQGCFDELQTLLDKIHFNPKQDKLWFVGDLVNRGPKSLECLRFVKKLSHQAITVLGNHDLHLIAVYYGHQALKKGDTLQAILDAPDAADLIEWLCHQPLVHHDASLQFTLVHAGIPPQWSITEALAKSKEVETALQGTQRQELLKHMYGSLPDQWDENLQGFDRLRLIINYFTRMRFCDADGKLTVSIKTKPQDAPAGWEPWFTVPRKTTQDHIVFGHWAALEGITNDPYAHGIDTGCVWGNRLTALNLNDLTETATVSHLKTARLGPSE